MQAGYASPLAPWLSRPVPDRLFVTRRFRVSRKIIVNLEPRHLLFDMHMRLRHDSRGVFEAAGIQIDVIGPSVTFIR
jgi:hypothetical protein